MPSPSSTLRLGLVVLLVLSGLAFPLAIVAERAAVAGEHPEAAAPVAGVGTGERGAAEGEAGHAEGDTEGERSEGAGAERAGEPAGADRAEGGSQETLFGIDPESDMTVAAAVILSLLLAIAIWARPSPALLGAVIVFALVFAALDVREAQHQAAESRDGLLAAASLIALLHLAIAAVALYALWARPRTSEAPA